MKDRLIELIKENCALEKNITIETNLKEISMDSLSFISLIVNLETEFDDEELDIYGFETVEEIMSLVKFKLLNKIKEFSND